MNSGSVVAVVKRDARIEICKVSFVVFVPFTDNTLTQIKREAFIT